MIMQTTDEYIITYEKADDFAEHVCKQSYTDFNDAKNALKRIKEYGCFNIKFKHVVTKYFDVSQLLSY